MAKKPKRKDLDRAIEKELVRLGLEADLTVGRDRFYFGPDGEQKSYRHRTEVDLADGEVYVRGRPQDILPVLRSIPKGVDLDDVWEALDRAGLERAVYPCSWEIGDGEWGGEF